MRVQAIAQLVLPRQMIALPRSTFRTLGLALAAARDRHGVVLWRAWLDAPITGRLAGTIIAVHTTDSNYKGHVHHASEGDPQYEIKSDKTDHIAAHKGSALEHTPE